MVIEKTRGLTISEKVFKAIKKEFKDKETGTDIYVDTFNNCRETGYCFKVYRNGEHRLNSMIIWTCECRNSDDLMLVRSLDQNWCDAHNMFTDKDFHDVMYFKANEEREFIDDVIMRIKNFVGGVYDHEE